MKLQFKLRNLGCPACAAAVQATVKGLPGVQHVCADFASATLQVEGVDLDKGAIITAVAESGADISAAEESEEGDEPPRTGRTGAKTSSQAALTHLHHTADTLANNAPDLSNLSQSDLPQFDLVSRQAAKHVSNCPLNSTQNSLPAGSASEVKPLDPPANFCDAFSVFKQNDASLVNNASDANPVKASTCACCAGNENLLEPAGSLAGFADPVNNLADEEHSQKQGREIKLLAFCALLFAGTMLWEHFGGSLGGSSSDVFGGGFGATFFSTSNTWLIFALYAAPYLLCGVPVLLGAWRALCRGSLFNEFSLMSLATLAAIALGEMPEAVGVMLFYRLGEFFQEKALARSRTSIKTLLASKVNVARVLKFDGVIVECAVENVLPGQIILVRAGEKVPLDGRVKSGTSQLNTASLNGEPTPLCAGPGDNLLAGYLNLDALLEIEVTAPFKDSQMAHILELMQNAAQRKAAPERFVSAFARVYTPIVFALAVLVACLPPLLSGASWQEWIYRSLVLLVISCPCALIISIPLSYFAGLGGASQRGILVKGGLVLDALKHIRAVVFDKTGTLTEGLFAVNRILPALGVSEAELLQAAAVAECESNHPLAKAIMSRVIENNAASSWQRPSDLSVQELAGLGVKARSQGREYLAGKADLLEQNNISGFEAQLEELSGLSGSLIFVAQGGRYLGCILVADTLRPESAPSIAHLREQGLRAYMLTGDRVENAASVARSLNLDGFKAGLLPVQKVEALQELALPQEVMFVGDGANDGPILATAGIGVAMGGAGSAIAVEAADAVILGDNPAKVAELFELGRRVRRVVWQNIGLALGVKLIFMGLGIAGLSGLWEAVFADVGVALVAVLNASRAA